MTPAQGHSNPDDLAAVRAESDPIQQARMAGDLIETYRQRAEELAQLRAAAIETAVTRGGKTYAAVAADLGLTRGRVSQIRRRWTT